MSVEKRWMAVCLVAIPTNVGLAIRYLPWWVSAPITVVLVVIFLAAFVLLTEAKE